MSKLHYCIIAFVQYGPANLMVLEASLMGKDHMWNFPMEKSKIEP